MVNFTTIANLASLTVDEAQEPKCGRRMDRLVGKEFLEFVESLLASAILDEHALYYNCDCYLGTKGLAGQGGSVQISRRKKFQHKAEGILVERETSLRIIITGIGTGFGIGSSFGSLRRRRLGIHFIGRITRTTRCGHFCILSGW